MEESTIYKIECLATGRAYIGMTRNFEARRHSHLSLLYSRKHYAKELQRDFDKFGESGLLFQPLRMVPRKHARAEELREMHSLAASGRVLYNPEVNRKRRGAPRRVPPTPLVLDGPDEEYTVPQAAALLQVGRTAIYHLFQWRENPLCFKVIDEKGTRRVLKSHLIAFLNAAPRCHGASA